jgi:hypothetical protein
MQTAYPKKGMKKNRRTSQAIQWTMATVASYVTIMVLLLTCSCSTAKSTVGTTGQVIAREGDTFLLLFKEIGGKPHTYSYLWVYQPGIGIIPTEQLDVRISIRPKEKY